MLIYLLMLVFIGISSYFCYIRETNSNVFINDCFRKKKELYSILIAIVMMMLIFALRNISVGVDTNTYSEFYQAKKANPYLSFFETGYEIIGLISVFLGLDFNGMLFIISIIMFVPLLFFVKKYSINPLLSIFLYISLCIYSQAFNGMRQFIALSIFIIAIKYLITGKCVKYFICICIAVMFHSSAVILLPMYFLRYIKLNRKSIISILVLVLLLSFFIEPIVKLISKFSHFNYYERYFVGQFTQGLDLFNILYCMVMLSLFILFYCIRKHVKKDNLHTYNIFLTLFYLFVLIRILATFSGMFSLINRFTMYFFFSIIFLVPYFFENIKDKRYSKFVYLITLLTGLVYFVLSIAIRQSNGIYPYEFWIDDTIVNIVIHFIYCLMGYVLIKINYIGGGYKWKIRNY